MNIQIWLWSILALVFLILEIGHPGLFYFISFCFGAMNAAFFAYMGYSLSFQVINFFVSTISALFLLRVCVKSMRNASHPTNVSALIGKEAIVIEPINPDQPGYVKIQGELWLARSLAKAPLQQGTLVRVVNVRGAHVVVDQTN